MIDAVTILLSLVAVFWVIVRAAMLDQVRPWADKLPQRSGRDPS